MQMYQKRFFKKKKNLKHKGFICVVLVDLPKHPAFVRLTLPTEIGQ
jgi:hypothetical protein